MLNAFRSYAAEFGIVGPAGTQNVNALTERVPEGDSLPENGARPGAFRAAQTA